MAVTLAVRSFRFPRREHCLTSTRVTLIFPWLVGLVAWFLYTAPLASTRGATFVAGCLIFMGIWISMSMHGLSSVLRGRAFSAGDAKPDEGRF